VADLSFLPPASRFGKSEADWDKCRRLALMLISNGLDLQVLIATLRFVDLHFPSNIIPTPFVCLIKEEDYIEREEDPQCFDPGRVPERDRESGRPTARPPTLCHRHMSIGVQPGMELLLRRRRIRRHHNHQRTRHILCLQDETLREEASSHFSVPKTLSRVPSMRTAV